MDGNDLYKALNEIDDDILERSEKAVISGVIPMRRRLPIVLIAVLLCLFLMGAGVVAVVYGDNIQNWFGYYWENITGQPMSDEQKELIEHLSQEINISETVGDITVTVDSATVGEDNFFLLLRVHGMKFSDRYDYGFDTISFEVSPDPTEQSAGIGSLSFQTYGIDGDGTLIMLANYKYGTKQGFVPDIRPLEVTLNMSNFVRSKSADKEKLLVDGEWKFNFTLDRSLAFERITLPDTEVMVIDYKQKEKDVEVPIVLEKIEITSTGFRCQCEFKVPAPFFKTPLKVVLKNGQAIRCAGGTSCPLEGTDLLYCSYRWSVPVELSEVSAIRIGDMEIPVP